MSSFIWGAGSGGRLHVQQHEGEIDRITAFIDNDPALWGQLCEGRPVLDPSAIRPGDDVTICCPMWSGEVALQLERMGVVDYTVSTTCIPPFEREIERRRDEGPPRFGEEHRRVRGLLADGVSARIYTRACHAWTAGDPVGVEESPYPNYHHPWVPIPQGGVVVDGGAYDGANSHSFLRAGAGHVVAVDPIPRGPLTRPLPPRLTLLRGVLGSRPGTVRVTDELSVSRIDESGSVEARVFTLCEIANDHGLDMLKLDIEGAETESIWGSADVLRRHRPSLAISIYHSREDMWRLPLLIHDILPDHRLWVGHHSKSWAETVLYARAA